MRKLEVHLDLGGEALTVGTLAEQDRRTFFEYAPGFLASGLQLSPIHLPLRAGVHEGPPTPFAGHLARDHAAVVEAFRRMVFNVLACNRDDHARNFAFLMEPDGAWRHTPAYDLTFSSGPGGEHTMSVAGEGRAPGRRHFAELAAKMSVDPPVRDAVLERVGRGRCRLAGLRGRNRRGRRPRGGDRAADRPDPVRCALRIPLRISGSGLDWISREACRKR